MSYADSLIYLSSDVSNNNISILVPLSFIGASHLRLLYVRKIHHMCTILTSIIRNISINSITSIQASAFDGLTGLITLDLSCNRLTAILANTFSPLSKLIDL